VSILVVDVGTSSVRAGVVHPDGTVAHVHRRSTPPSVPVAGLVEFDAALVADAALEVAGQTISAAGGPPAIEGVGVTAQRASAIVWDGRDGHPVGPGLGWQDLRTVGTCLELQAQGLRFSPSESATKFAWLLDQLDADTRPHARLGTVDSWLAWRLTNGASHITDPSNAGVTGLYSIAAGGWREEAAAKLGLDVSQLPRIVDSSGQLAEATALPGAPPLCALVGDQQASLIGQGCTREGLAKATFGTGAMLDVCRGFAPPAGEHRSVAGCFPIAAWQIDGRITYATEAILLAAGSAVDWLVEDMRLLSSPAESETVAGECEDSAGVVAVPALLGYGTPQWDFGARGAIFGLTRGSTRAHVVRAVLEGIAHSGADLLEAAEADTGLRIERLRVDGGMSANSVFVAALADACGRPIEVSPELEATTLGAGYLAGLALGTWAGTNDVAASWSPQAVVEPSGRPSDRDRWREATRRAGEWYPDLTNIKF
jgi:glycerol kinase